MRILNLGCGYPRLPAPFINVDNLRTQLAEGTPERKHLDAEPNYIEHDIRKPFPDGFPVEVDGVLLSHVIEHLDLQESLILLWRCRELLRPGGVLRVSVPDPDYFWQIRQTGDGPGFVRATFDPGYGASVGWTEFALFYTQHKQCINATTLGLQLSAAGFALDSIRRAQFQVGWEGPSILMAERDNRDKFSVFMEAVRTLPDPDEGHRNHHNHRVSERSF